MQRQNLLGLFATWQEQGEELQPHDMVSASEPVYPKKEYTVRLIGCEHEVRPPEEVLPPTPQLVALHDQAITPSQLFDQMLRQLLVARRHDRLSDLFVGEVCGVLFRRVFNKAFEGALNHGSTGRPLPLVVLRFFGARFRSAA